MGRGIGLACLALAGLGCPGSAELGDGPVLGPARSAVHVTWSIEDELTESLYLSSVPGLCGVMRKAQEDLQASEDEYLVDASALHPSLPVRDWNRIDCQSRLARAKREAAIHGRTTRQNGWTVHLTQHRYHLIEGRFSAANSNEPRFSAQLERYRSNPYEPLANRQFDCEDYGERGGPGSLPIDVTPAEWEEALDWREVTRAAAYFTERSAGMHVEMVDADVAAADDDERFEGTLDLKGTFTRCEMEVPL